MAYVFERLGQGGIGEITIPPISNLALSEVGILTWNAPDISKFEEFGISLSYILDVNTTILETLDTTYDVSYLLIEGNNAISVVVKASFNSAGDDHIIKYSPPEKLTVLNVTVPAYTPGKYSLACFSIGDNIYTYEDRYTGGGSGTTKEYYFTEINTITEEKSRLIIEHYPTSIYASNNVKANIVGDYLYIINSKEVLKYNTFDKTTEWMYLESPIPIDGGSFSVAVGNSIYFFGSVTGGNEKVIVEFDTLSNTFTTLSCQTPTGVGHASAIAAGDIIYIFGGYDSYNKNNGTYGVTNNIIKFDTQNETCELLDVKLPVVLQRAGIGIIGNNIYIFGGTSYTSSSSYWVMYDTIYKFNITTEKLTTLDIKLPVAKGFIFSTTHNNVIYLIGGQHQDATFNEEVYKFTASSSN